MQATAVSGTEANRALAWHALYTRHQHEKVVAEMLRAKNFDAFVPLYAMPTKWKDRKKTLSLPLFPCYVFVRGEANRRSQILSTPGVFMILRDGEQDAVIPGEEMDALRKADGHYLMEPHPYLQSGDRVRIKRGPLKDVEGFVVRQKNQVRLIISVNILSKSASVEVDAANLEPIPDPVKMSSFAF